MPFHACNWGSTPHGDANNKNEGLCYPSFFVILTPIEIFEQSIRKRSPSELKPRTIPEQ